MRVTNLKEMVILVDKNDKQIGIEEKLNAHRYGKLHRAFSIFVFNRQKEMLLQRRAKSKYHSGGLWTNACCSHPCPGESIMQAACRRLNEEMGFSCSLKELFSFIYKALLEKGVTEFELDHVLVGTYGRKISPNPHEVMDYMWVDMDILKSRLDISPDSFTVWFKIALRRMELFNLSFW